jgi:CyaY protein
VTHVNGLKLKQNYSKISGVFMTEKEFLEFYRSTVERLEGIIEDAMQQDMDIDYECANDMLTINFSNGSVAIISRQSAISQLWLAAISGGFHFDFLEEDQSWMCKMNGKSLSIMLEDICKEQGGLALSFDV